MIKAKIIYLSRGDFALLKLQDSDDYFISVLIPNFYPTPILMLVRIIVSLPKGDWETVISTKNITRGIDYRLAP
ncbi:hypothetical protein JHU04_004347 [Brenneria sp. 4F2]|nr:hypothetical protein [Brenneria bubanii]